MLRLLPFLCFFAAVSAAAEVDPSVVAKLREGGYVLYMRHTSTDFSKNDRNMKGFEDCANQRNLTDKGRDEARDVATEIKRLGIPVGEVPARSAAPWKRRASPSARRNRCPKCAAARCARTIRRATKA